jgi:hypothetical protein
MCMQFVNALLVYNTLKTWHKFAVDFDICHKQESLEVVKEVILNYASMI